MQHRRGRAQRDPRHTVNGTSCRRGRAQRDPRPVSNLGHVMARWPLRSSTARPAATALTRPCSQSMGKRQRPAQPRRRALLNSNIPTVIGSREPSEEPRGQRRALLDSDIPTVLTATWVPCWSPSATSPARFTHSHGTFATTSSVWRRWPQPWAAAGRGPALETSRARFTQSHGRSQRAS